MKVNLYFNKIIIKKKSNFIRLKLQSIYLLQLYTYISHLNRFFNFYDIIYSIIDILIINTKKGTQNELELPFNTYKLYERSYSVQNRFN